MRSTLLTTRKREWKQIFWLTILFLLYTLHTTLLINLYLGYVKGLGNIKAVIPNYHFPSELLSATLLSLIGGLFFSSLEVFYFSKKFKTYSYGRSIVFKFLLYGILVFGLTISSTLFYYSYELNTSPFDKEVLELSKDYLASTGIFHTLILVIIPVLIMIFLVQINEKMGQGVLWQLLTGEFREPKEQTRIFMFLDIKSSTSIAEKIGHAQFHKLLNQFFSDVTLPIIKNKGEIYQYIGDEIVITWTMSNGTTNARCVQCFFDIYQTIQDQATLYQEQFGIVPEFKAGMHYGKVMTGEIGIIKKEITHSGEVLNIAARIQELCNSLGCKFIISQSLLKILQLNGQYHMKDLGTFELRGRTKKVALIAMTLKDKVEKIYSADSHIQFQNNQISKNNKPLI